MMTANPTVKTVVSSQTPESIFVRRSRSGMLTLDGGHRWHISYTYDRDLPYAVGVKGADYDKARRFATPEDAFVAFPALRAYCEREAVKPTWEDHFRAALVAAADVAGCDISALCWDHATMDSTWGNRVGLVFWGASDACNKRAAEFFSRWACKNGERFGLFGGYNAQQSTSEVSRLHFSRFESGAEGWYKDYGTPSYSTRVPVETRIGWAASYVYYPCAD